MPEASTPAPAIAAGPPQKKAAKQEFVVAAMSEHSRGPATGQPAMPEVSTKGPEASTLVPEANTPAPAPVAMESEQEPAKQEQKPVVLAAAQQAPKPVVVKAEMLRQKRSIVVRRGDTLWHIARRRYGRGIRYTAIYRNNRDQIRNPHLIYPGQEFRLPVR